MAGAAQPRRAVAVRSRSPDTRPIIVPPKKTEGE